MNKLYGSLIAVFAALVVWNVAHQENDRTLQITGGHTTLAFYPGVLRSEGLKVAWNGSAEGDKTRSEPSYGFKIDFSNLQYQLSNLRVSRFTAGLATHKGGFSLTRGAKSLNADQFSIAPSPTSTNTLQILVDGPKGTYAAFDLLNASAVYDYEHKQLLVGNLDVTLTLQGAQSLGRADLAGKTLGYLKVFGDSEPIDGRGDVQPPKDGGDHQHMTGTFDLALSDMGGISWIGRTGTYPNGNNALTLYTTSCNVGDQPINWNPPMNTTHPAIIMNLYREYNGRFEQIGWSWVKHGFYATNVDGCGSCSHSGGYQLWPACSDTYGGGNNDDQYYLGGRDEWNALTGVWTCQNSWFSNYMNDCTRRNTGSGLSVTDHRLSARDADLGIDGAQYFYEARYITQNENATIYNNIGSRSCTMHWTGSSWSFQTTDGAEVVGPAINRWGDVRNIAQPQSDGDVIVAVKTTDLGNGMYHYEYALYNSSLDQQVREFAVPVPGGANVQNIEFRDIDQDGANQWSPVRANGMLTWTSPVYGSNNANPLKYSSIFNFRFDCNVPPGTNTGTLTEFKPSGLGTLTVATVAPINLSPATGYTLVNASLVSGDIQSLAASDDNRLKIKSNDSGPCGLEVTGTVANGSPASLIIGIESNAGLFADSRTRGFQKVELWNWSTNAYELVDNRSLTGVDSFAPITISANASRFVQSGTNQVKARVMASVMSPRPFRVAPAFDQIGFAGN